GKNQRQHQKNRKNPLQLHVPLSSFVFFRCRSVFPNPTGRVRPVGLSVAYRYAYICFRLDETNGT
ncbi:MAG: hypothetical protein RSC06_10010, partial [Clostridia bacterium]